MGTLLGVHPIVPWFLLPPTLNLPGRNEASYPKNRRQNEIEVMEANELCNSVCCLFVHSEFWVFVGAVQL